MPTRIPSGIGMVGADIASVVNLDENPSFELGIDGVDVLNGTIAQSGTKAKWGSYSCKGTQTGGASDLVVYKYRGDDTRWPVVTGEPYVHSLSAQMGTGEEAYVRIGIGWYDVGENLLSNSFSGFYLIGGSAWTDMEVSATTPGNAVSARIHLSAFTGFANGEVIYLDGQEFRRASSYEGSYIDGDQGGCFWLGTIHASVSERRSALALQAGEAKTTRTVEGRARTVSPLPSGKAE